MQMLTKFESKSNRVKGIAFHPSLPLLAATLHNGSIQLWNYQTGTIYDRLDEHDGPVRGICFHPTQPLLVSGGDDYKIKVWNHKTRTCLFTLNGHLDYVRTVFFHHTQPWILSASDDQTIRIWNWQSRQCIAILTGHNHYIMCAQFHPTEDLIVSASMDQTVRVWDISGLRKKSAASSSNGTASSMPMSIEEQIARAASGSGLPGALGGQADLFGSTDAMVKYVLEGHDRGVNWASFHPTLPLIVSAGDDRQVKLWRMSETKAWEVDTCRGHFNNVSSALFHPRHELIISDAEDKTIRVWDMGKRTAVQTFRREADRFWVLTAHPKLNLFAAGHDSGLIVFKLERERPAFSVHQQTLYYVRDKQIRQLDYQTGTDHAVLSVKKLGSAYVQPRTLSFNPAERSVLVVSANSGASSNTNGDAPAQQGVYDLAPLPREGAAVAGLTQDLQDSGAVGKRGHGSSAIFVARNRIAVLDRVAQQIEIRDLSNNVTKAFPCPQSRGGGGDSGNASVVPTTTHEIFFGGTASLLLSTNSGVIMYDIQQQKILGELASPLVKYIAWSADGNSVALLSKHTITIANKSLGQSTLIHETIRIKSACWDDTGVLIYTTLNHIKYALPNGDSGIIKTLQQPVYVTRVKGKTVSVLDRTARPKNIVIDPTEYRFKLALSMGNYDEVLSIIKNSNLVGQAIIAYLQKKGYPEIALHFVNDKTTRFDLAIECGNLDVALETAEAIGADEVWQRLAEAALKLGNVKVVERAYQRIKAFEKLSFLYLITGNVDKLAKMSVIAERRGDAMSRYHNALYLGDAHKQVELLKDVGMDALAYATARSHGLLDDAAAIADAAGATPGMTGLETGGDDVQSNMQPLRPPQIVTPAYKYAWPVLPGKESFFDKALVANAEDGQVIFKDNAVAEAVDADEWLEADGFADAEEEIDDPDGILAAAGTTATGGVLASTTAIASAAAAEEAWDLEETELPVNSFDAPVVTPLGDRPLEGTEPGSSETEHWLRNSALAADHCAAGSFKTAMTLLSRQVGVVHFAPLKQLFLTLSVAAKASIPGAPALDPLELPLRRNLDETSKQKVLPARLWSVRDLSSGELQEAYKAVNGNKLEDAQTIFRGLLYKLVLTVAIDEAEAAEINDLLLLCREYLLGISIELERRESAKADPSFTSSPRGLELAALFTHAQMQSPHLTIALRSAMNVASKAGNFVMAASFANRLLALHPPPPERVAQQAQQVLSVADRSPRDAVPVPSYDPRERSFVICGASHTLIPAADAGGAVTDPLTQQAYLPEYKGTLCRITGISEIGKITSGLRPLA
ncbi:putative COP1-coatomer complex alpha chain of secretory pathway vesicles [Tilletiaria anomala UBC 951]|uniref:Putative COP1-coatomer complex alpha chain of secretory pathway vesicles n=1 Tax=Tilletiaria anomala (strain ATCC 24038 / CBS 436.72 / UBC 951) TaxID=1037660 RepID=A0A066VNJ2_TILAU|nr:putative COP1-coatomer complex alpha chain of secretory pathway vesicles [Tilletiaria anomala UBC 951]KDN43312.1 putative COP1-coatomer complex alpha chain of secretory pathway vesicles [Tilletiaria anomala UBC 951]